MASTYTTNLGIEKPGTGEQSGTWGTTANTNYDLIDQAINGIVQVTLAAAGSSGSPNTIDITNGTASDGRNKYIEFVDGGDLGATAYVQLDPNDAEKIVHMRNSLSGSRSVIVFQGTYNASNDFEIPNGKDVVLKFDGGGASATVTQVFVDLKLDALDAATVAATTGNITTVNSTTVDTTNLEVTNLKAKDGTSAGSIADSTGVVTIASAVLTTADINGGTMDGVTIGGASTAAGSFTTVTASGRVTFGELKGTGATVVNTILDEDNMATNSDTALATQQSIKAYVDSQVGTVDTLAEILANGNTSGTTNLIMTAGQSLTTDSILETSAGNGVNIDSVVLKDGDVNGTIGQVTAKAANFTTVGTSSNVTVGGTLGVTGATTLSSSLSVNTGAVFNEGGGDNDFRVESDTNQHMLFVDAGNNAVGINQSVPSAKLHITTGTNSGTGQQIDLGLDDGSASNPIAVKIDQIGGTTSDGVYPWDVSIGGAQRAYQFVSRNGAGTGAKVVHAVLDSASTMRSRMEFTNTESVFNEPGENFDFRVESDNKGYMFYIDASTDTAYFGGSDDRGFVNIEKDAPLASNGAFTSPHIALQALTQPTDNDGFVGMSLATSDSDNYGFTIGAQRTTGGSGSLVFRNHFNNASGTVMMEIKGGSGVVLNDDGNDQDFRVESDNNANMLFVDAGNDFVGIMNATDFGGALNVNGGLNSKQAVFTSTNNRGIALSTATRGGQNDGVAIVDAQDTESTGGRLELHTMGAVRASFERDQIIFNESGNDQDFRVESDGNSHQLFVDAADNYVGINTSTRQDTVTSSALVVNGATATRGSSVDNVGTTYVNSGLTFSNGSYVELVTIRGNISGANAYSTATYIVTAGAYSKTITQLGSASNHFGNGYLSAQLDSSSAATVNFQVKWNGVGASTGTVFVNTFRLI